MLALSLTACSAAPPGAEVAASERTVVVVPSPVAAPPPAESETPPGLVWHEPQVEVQAFATEAAAARHTRRATQFRLGPMRLERVGPAAWAPQDGRPQAMAPTELTVLERGPNTLRVLRETELIAIALYVDETDFQRRPARLVELRPRPNELYKDGMVLLYPGAEVSFREEPGSGERVSLHFGAPTLSATGYVPPESIGVVYEPRTPEPFEADWTLTWPVGVLDAPSGSHIAALHGSPAHPVKVKKLGSERDRHQYIHFSADRIAVEGWVSLERDYHGGGWGRGTFGRGGHHASHLTSLAAHTVLYGSANGEAIGTTRRANRVRVGGLEGERQRIEILIPDYGFVPVFVAKGAIASKQ